MRPKWKLFRVLIFVEIISIVSFVAYAFYRDPLTVHSAEDFLGVSVIIAYPLVTAINGINNVTLLPLLHTGVQLTLSRQIIFWIFGILFLAGCLTLSVLVISLIYELLKQRFSENHNDRMMQFRLLAFFIIWIVNGLYIFVIQSILYRTLKKNYQQKSLVDIDNIGNNLIN